MSRKSRAGALPDGVRFLLTFEDASGAESLIDVTVDGQRFTYACNLVGVPSIHLVAPMSGSRAASKRAAVEVRKRYDAALATLPADYIERNRALYSEVAS